MSLYVLPECGTGAPACSLAAPLARRRTQPRAAVPHIPALTDHYFNSLGRGRRRRASVEDGPAPPLDCARGENRREAGPRSRVDVWV